MYKIKYSYGHYELYIDGEWHSNHETEDEAIREWEEYRSVYNGND